MKNFIDSILSKAVGQKLKNEMKTFVKKKSFLSFMFLNKLKHFENLFRIYFFRKFQNDLVIFVQGVQNYEDNVLGRCFVVCMFLIRLEKFEYFLNKIFWRKSYIGVSLWSDEKL